MLNLRLVSAIGLALLVACDSSGELDAGPGDADGATQVDTGRPDADAGDGSIDAGDGGDVEDSGAWDADAGDTGDAADSGPDAGDVGDADVDSGQVDAADAGEADADLDAGDAGEEDADSGETDAGDLDATADAGDMDAGPDAGPDVGYHRVTVIGPWNGVSVGSGAWFGDCPIAGPVTTSSCTLWVSDGAYVSMFGEVPGQCYWGSGSILCGASPQFLCANIPPPPSPTTICDGIVNSDLTVSYSLIYDGAFSPCAPPPTTCPSTLECGYIGTLSCGGCAVGEACSLNAFASECVPSQCP